MHLCSVFKGIGDSILAQNHMNQDDHTLKPSLKDRERIPEAIYSQSRDVANNL